MKDAVDRATGQEVLIHFSVRDTGIGISPNNISRLFQSFSQVPLLHDGCSFMMLHTSALKIHFLYGLKESLQYWCCIPYSGNTCKSKDSSPK